MDGIWCRTDGATSGARRDSKRVETRPLAGVEIGQHERRNNMKAHVPEPSIPLPNDPKRPTNPPNPPRRRGRLKTNPRRISQARSRSSTHHVIRSRQDRIGRVGCIRYIVYGVERVQEPRRAMRNAKTRPVEPIEADHTPGCARTLAEPRLSISGNRSSAARRHLE